MTNIFRIELLPARHGDALWVEYGTESAPRRILIDGGPLGSYPQLRARVSAVPARPRKFELMVVTHIDNDHIEGALKLLNDRELDVSYGDMWFNGWSQLEKVQLAPRGPEEAPAGSRGPMQGGYLGERIQSYGIEWNQAFEGGPVVAPDNGALPAVTLAGGLRLTLLSPSPGQLLDLRKEWEKAFRKEGIDPEDRAAIAVRLRGDKRYRGLEETPTSTLAAEMGAMAPQMLDDSVANGSSIAFLAEYAGRRAAFLADSHMPEVEASVARLSKALGETPLRLDAIKVSHHGSQANTTESFLRRVRCRNFLVSTDGSIFGHPDAQAIERILAGAEKPARLVFNYRSPTTAPWDDAKRKKARKYATQFPAAESQGVVFDVMGAAANPAPQVRGPNDEAV